MPTTSQQVLNRAKKFVPVAVKRPLRKALPARYLRYVDPDWHRRVIGNAPHWEYMGKLQLDYLVERSDGPTGTTHYDADIFHYGLDAMQFACEGTGLSVEYEGDFGHPRNQKMLVFVRSAGD